MNLLKHQKANDKAIFAVRLFVIRNIIDVRGIETEETLYSPQTIKLINSQVLADFPEIGQFI